MEQELTDAALNALDALLERADDAHPGPDRGDPDECCDVREPLLAAARALRERVRELERPAPTLVERITRRGKKAKAP